MKPWSGAWGIVTEIVEPPDLICLNFLQVPLLYPCMGAA
jgi:hypothetical protein